MFLKSSGAWHSITFTQSDLSPAILSLFTQAVKMQIQEKSFNKKSVYVSALSRQCSFHWFSAFLLHAGDT